MNHSVSVINFHQLIEELTGSIDIPGKLKGKNIDEIIQTAKRDYFRSKYKSKQL